MTNSWVTKLAAIVGLAALGLIASFTSGSDADAQSTYREQQGSRGVNTFTNYHSASGLGPRIEAGVWVDVSCKVHDPTIPSVNPDGYWYRIASAPWNNQYYAPANTFMNGDPWGGPYSHNTDFAVPDCGAVAAPPTPVPQTPRVVLAQGPVAPSGFRYAVTLERFAPNSPVTVQCFDTVSPSGFYTFALRTDASGRAFTQSQCYSGAGPEHWVVAGGISSNRVRWGASGGVRPTPPPTPMPIRTPTPIPTVAVPTGGLVRSVFYSPNNEQLKRPPIYTLPQFNTPIGDRDLAYDIWRSPDGSPRCTGTSAFSFENIPAGVTTLSGWSRGRLGPMYFLAATADQRAADLATLRTIVLYDPGSRANMDGSCEPQFTVSVGLLISNWLKHNPANRLYVFTGHDTEEHRWPGGRGLSRYRGLWKYYFPDIWNTPEGANQTIVCDYNNMSHSDVLRNFAGFARRPSGNCPSAPAGYTLTQWHP